MAVQSLSICLCVVAHESRVMQLKRILWQRPPISFMQAPHGLRLRRPDDERQALTFTPADAVANVTGPTFISAVRCDRFGRPAGRIAYAHVVRPDRMP